MHQRASKEGHKEELARAVSVPKDAAPPVAGTRLDHSLDALPDSVELVVARDLLDRPFALVLEDGETGQCLKKRCGRRKPWISVSSARLGPSLTRISSSIIRQRMKRLKSAKIEPWRAVMPSEMTDRRLQGKSSDKSAL